jgi:hypothetical protein
MCSKRELSERISYIDVVKNIPKDFLFGNIGFAVVFVDMGASMNDAIHVQIEIVKIRYLWKENTLFSDDSFMGSGAYLIIIDDPTDIGISF